jgi:hypothetical protein
VSNHGTGKKLRAHGGLIPMRQNDKYASPYPQAKPRRPSMDLSYPIGKLEARAEYERECAESPHRLALSGGSNEPTVYASDGRDSEYKAGCAARAAACEEAVRILREHGSL